MIARTVPSPSAARSASSCDLIHSCLFHSSYRGHAVGRVAQLSARATVVKKTPRAPATPVISRSTAADRCRALSVALVAGQPVGAVVLQERVALVGDGPHLLQHSPAGSGGARKISWDRGSVKLIVTPIAGAALMLLRRWRLARARARSSGG